MNKVKNISRRDFLRGAGAVAASSLLPHFPNIVRADNHEINIFGWASPWFDPLFEACKEATGITIHLQGLPARWSDTMQKVSLWGQSGYSYFDVMMMDDITVGLYGTNGWALDLSDLDAYTDNVDDIVDSVHELDNRVGGVFRLLYFFGAAPFFYNTDLVPERPTNWDEFLTAAQAATDKEAGVWGWRPMGGQGIAFQTVLQALHHTGADLETLNDDATRTALQWMYDWVHTYEITPPSTINEGYGELIGLTAAGKAGMLWQYEETYNQVLNTVDSVMTADNYKWGRFPMGPANDNLLSHGWGYAIPKAATKIDQAKEVVNFLAQADNLRYVALQGLPPPLKSLTTEDEVVAALPVLGGEPSWEELLEGAVFRYPIVDHKQAVQIWSMLDQLGEMVLSGERTVDEAFQWLQDEYAIIKFAY